jgi:cystathionine gamma-synthase
MQRHRAASPPVRFVTERGGGREATTLATAGVAEDRAHRAVAPPLVLSTTFAWEDHEEKPAYDYARRDHPNRTQLTDALLKLEGAAAGTIVPSGLAAVNLCLELVKPGERVVAPHDCYGGTHRLLCAKAARGQFEVVFPDLADRDKRRAALGDRTRLVIIETPSNPLMRLLDIEAVAGDARRAGALTVADNTFLSPVLQNPIALGADVVVHSNTKFIAGHSDVVGGAVLAAKRDLGEELSWWANCTGAHGPAFDSWLTLRGLRTLGLRIRAQQETANRLAEWLANDPRISAVHFPGLKTHPDHALSKRQQKGPGAVLSAELAEGLSLPRFLGALRIVTLAESLGGFESLISVPDTMTHAGMDEQARREAGITPGLFRLSVGLEDADDLQEDLERALAAASLSP